ncbi:MAG: hypothetical protein GEU76_14040 [Alphaproteobacteria bacterium]|nr:hypothetical protein [Alphaproteobacteria bacterium]
MTNALLDLISATGRETEGTEYEAAFRKYLESIMMTELTMAARRKWSDQIRHGLINRPHLLRGISSGDLSEQELRDVQEMALELACYHHSYVRKGQPTKHQQDTLLIGLGDLYVEFAQLHCDPYELPHSKYSLFISFAYEALQPFFARTEVSRTALSHRWLRLKDAYRTAPKTTRFRRCPD